MYNSDFVNEEAEHFAARVRDLAGDGARQQIRCAFEIALGRPPTASETSYLEKLMKLAPSPDDALVGVCRVLYNTTEFLYID